LQKPRISAINWLRKSEVVPSHLTPLVGMIVGISAGKIRRYQHAADSYDR